MVADLEGAYAALREAMLRAAPGMTVVEDGPGELLLHAPWSTPLKPKEPVFFGSVTSKSYVAYHLFPLYLDPSMKDGMSPALTKRMQGKTCFNFKAPDPALFAELEALTAEGARRFAQPFTPERPH